MSDKINLHFESLTNGPGKVVKNLALGLSKIGFEVHGNDIPRPAIYQGSLQLTKMVHALGRKTLMGPNLFVLPDEWGDYTKRFDHYVVPSSWVTNIYRQYSNLDHASIDEWPVGIDANFWNFKHTNRKNKTLLYYKNRNKEELDQLITSLKNNNINFEVISYGSYKEEDLVSAIQRCDSCLALGGTESQGIAFMEILASGIPIYALDQEDFSYKDLDKTHPATSFPYFDVRCGVKVKQFDITTWKEFQENLDNFDPRDFILQGHTLEKSAHEYVKLLKKYQ